MGWLSRLAPVAGPLLPAARAFLDGHPGAPRPLGEGGDGLRQLADAIDDWAEREEVDAQDEERFVEGAGAVLALLLLAHVGEGAHVAKEGTHRVRLGRGGFFDPFAAIAERFRATFTGRKRHHGGDRNQLPTVEVIDGLVRIHPLADWTADDMKRYMTTNSLPPHPLVAEGYASIGCAPCTDRVAEDEDVRAGRWRGTEKTECGIHLPSLGSTV